MIRTTFRTTALIALAMSTTSLAHAWEYIPYMDGGEEQAEASSEETTTGTIDQTQLGDTWSAMEKKFKEGKY